MNNYINSIRKRDPAAGTKLSIILTYHGAKALCIHRIDSFFV